MNEGWGACLGARKWHYFVEGRSLCRHYILFGKVDLEQGDDNNSDNCVARRRALMKRKAKRQVVK